MSNSLFLIPVLMGLTLVVLTIKVALERIAFTRPSQDFPIPSPFPTANLPSPSAFTFPPNYDSILWAACIEAVQNRRACLDETKLLWLIELSRTLDEEESKSATLTTTRQSNVIKYLPNTGALNYTQLIGAETSLASS